MHETLESITVFTLDWRASLFFHSYEEEVASPAVPFTCLWQSCWRSERRERFEQIHFRAACPVHQITAAAHQKLTEGCDLSGLVGRGPEVKGEQQCLAFALKWKSATLFLVLAVLLMWHKCMPGSHTVYVSVLYLSEKKKKYRNNNINHW